MAAISVLILFAGMETLADVEGYVDVGPEAFEQITGKSLADSAVIDLDKEEAYLHGTISRDCYKLGVEITTSSKPGKTNLKPVLSDEKLGSVAWFRIEASQPALECLKNPANRPTECHGNACVYLSDQTRINLKKIDSDVKLALAVVNRAADPAAPGNVTLAPVANYFTADSRDQARRKKKAEDEAKLRASAEAALVANAGRSECKSQDSEARAVLADLGVDTREIDERIKEEAAKQALEELQDLADAAESDSEMKSAAKKIVAWAKGKNRDYGDEAADMIAEMAKRLRESPDVTVDDLDSVVDLYASARSAARSREKRNTMESERKDAKIAEASLAASKGSLQESRAVALRNEAQLIAAQDYQAACFGGDPNSAACSQVRGVWNGIMDPQKGLKAQSDAANQFFCNAVIGDSQKTGVTDPLFGGMVSRCQYRELWDAPPQFFPGAYAGAPYPYAMAGMPGGYMGAPYGGAPMAMMPQGAMPPGVIGPTAPMGYYQPTMPAQYAGAPMAGGPMYY